jgi:hypothetical protein
MAVATLTETVPERRADAVRRSKAALRAFMRIMEAWQVPDDQARVLLGSPSRTTFHNYRTGRVPALGPDVLERISYILGIYKDLQVLIPHPESADAWVKKPNRRFNGQTALGRMLGGKVADLYEVRRYLDAARGSDL